MIVITGKKNVLQKKSRNWKTSLDLRLLTTVCLRGFDRNLQQLFTVFSLHHGQCLQHAVMNNKAAFNSRWRAFNFTQVSFRCVLVMPSNSVIKAEFLKNVYAKSIDLQKKNVYQLDSNLRPSECNSVILPIEPYGCGFRWNVAQVSSTSSSSIYCRMQSDHRINSWWQTWSRKMMGLRC